MDLQHVIARDDTKKTATMRLYGPIGSASGQTNGHYFAQELAYVSENYDQITLRVNCEGGEVVQGFSIFSAMLASTAKIIYSIEGIAASMGGFLAMAADEVHMNDFARLMIHNPYFPDQSKKLSDKQQKSLSMLSGMLSEMTAKRCGDVEKAKAYMEAETWFTAEEAKAAGFVDTIIQTGKAQTVAMQLSGIAALTSQSFDNYLQQKNEEMKVVASLFGLAETATEPEIVAQVTALKSEKAAADAKVVELQATITTLEAEKTASAKAEITALVDEKIEAGFFTKEMRESLITMGEQNIEGTKAMLNGLQKPALSVVAELAAGAVAGAGAPADDADKFLAMTKDGTAASFKVENPEGFKKLEAAYEKKYC